MELIPARQLEEDERSDGGTDSSRGQRRKSSAQTATEHSEPEMSPDGTGQGQGPRTYVDRVVQEILDTERTYVQDLQSIVEVRNRACSAVTQHSPHEKLETEALRPTFHIKAVGASFGRTSKYKDLGPDWSKYIRINRFS